MGQWFWCSVDLTGNQTALKKRMTECYSKWVRLSEDGAKLPLGISGELLDSPRAVVDNRFSKMTDEDARSQISSSMTYLSAKGPFRFAQTILILKDGSTEVIAKKDGSKPQTEPRAEPSSSRIIPRVVFWRSVDLTDNLTRSIVRVPSCMFWRSVDLTGSLRAEAERLRPAGRG